MTDIKIFKSQEFGQVRTVDVDGEPWLVGKDVAEALGYSDPAKAIRVHIDDEDKGVADLSTPGGIQSATIINESGLYSLVLSSKLPTAKKFKRWVTSEVLPSIRKHGLYATAETVDRMLADPDTAIRLLGEIKAEREKRRQLEYENARKDQIIADFEPIRQYVDTILESTGTMATSQIAADYDMSAKKLNQILHKAGIQRNVNGQWILYRKHMGKGYTKSVTFRFCHSDGRQDSKTQTQWTQKGRLMIHEVLKSRGICAVMDRGIN